MIVLIMLLKLDSQILQKTKSNGIFKQYLRELEEPSTIRRKTSSFKL